MTTIDLTTAEIEIATEALEELGYEALTAEQIEAIAAAAKTGDRGAVVRLIIGGATVSEAESDADAIIEAVAVVSETEDDDDSDDDSDDDAEVLAGVSAEERARRADAAEAGLEGAESWWESLGYTAGDYDGNELTHPVCDFDELGDHEPESELEARVLAYGRTAADAAHDVFAALEEAIAAYREGRDGDAEEALEEARRAESEYGDDPATAKCRAALGL